MQQRGANVDTSRIGPLNRHLGNFFHVPVALYPSGHRIAQALSSKRANYRTGLLSLCWGSRIRIGGYYVGFDDPCVPTYRVPVARFCPVSAGAVADLCQHAQPSWQPQYSLPELPHSQRMEADP